MCRRVWPSACDAGGSNVQDAHQKGSPATAGSCRYAAVDGCDAKACAMTSRLPSTMSGGALPRQRRDIRADTATAGLAPGRRAFSGELDMALFCRSMAFNMAFFACQFRGSATPGGKTAPGVFDRVRLNAWQVRDAWLTTRNIHMSTAAMSKVSKMTMHKHRCLSGPAG